MTAPNGIIEDWFSRYDRGDIAHFELLQLASCHITVHPEHAAAVLAVFQGHPDAEIRGLYQDMIMLLTKGEA